MHSKCLQCIYQFMLPSSVHSEELQHMTFVKLRQYGHHSIHFRCKLFK